MPSKLINRLAWQSLFGAVLLMATIASGVVTVLLATHHGTVASTLWWAIASFVFAAMTVFVLMGREATVGAMEREDQAARWDNDRSIERHGEIRNRLREMDNLILDTRNRALPAATYAETAKRLDMAEGALKALAPQVEQISALASDKVAGLEGRLAAIEGLSAGPSPQEIARMVDDIEALKRASRAQDLHSLDLQKSVSELQEALPALVRSIGSAKLTADSHDYRLERLYKRLSKVENHPLVKAEVYDGAPAGPATASNEHDYPKTTARKRPPDVIAPAEPESSLRIGDRVVLISEEEAKRRSDTGAVPIEHYQYMRRFFANGPLLVRQVWDDGTVNAGPVPNSGGEEYVWARAEFLTKLVEPGID